MRRPRRVRAGSAVRWAGCGWPRGTGWWRPGAWRPASRAGGGLRRAADVLDGLRRHAGVDELHEPARADDPERGVLRVHKLFGGGGYVPQHLYEVDAMGDGEDGAQQAPQA